MNDETREKLTRVRSIPMLENVRESVCAFSNGDRILFYLLAALVGIASLSVLYALEQSLLVEVPAYGGTLAEGVVGSPRFINPLLAMSDADRDLSALTYAGLMGISGTGDLVSILAESYDLSSDGKTYTFILNKNAKFSDGTPVTADDIVFTIQKAQSPALKSPKYADWVGVGVAAVDQRTVRFTLSKPYAPFLGLMTLGILPSRLWKNISDEEFPFSMLESNPVGAGPFKVTDVSRALDRQSIVDNVLGGYATPIIGPVPPGGSVRQVPVPRFENPTVEAASVLRAAGWTYDGSARVWENIAAKQTVGGR